MEPPAPYLPSSAPRPAPLSSADPASPQTPHDQSGFSFVSAVVEHEVIKRFARLCARWGSFQTAFL